MTTKMNSHKQKNIIVFFCGCSNFVAYIINAPFKNIKTMIDGIFVCISGKKKGDINEKL